MTDVSSATDRTLRYKVIGCEVLAREIYACAAHSDHTLDLELLPKGLHDSSQGLRDALQEQILAVPEEYDAVLLAYGLCGRSLAGLTAGRVPLVVPRAHDCITLYLGSRDRYANEFREIPGTYWYTADYMQRTQDGETVRLGSGEVTERNQYEDYVEKYGKGNADYLMEVMGKWKTNYTRAVFIRMGLGGDKAAEIKARAGAEKDGLDLVLMDGDVSLICKLVQGNWDEDCLVVPPGQRIGETYDEQILTCENAAPCA